ncbi:GEP5 (YLR091W) [Zygosaccharomyces parabailii]|nr:GEP5 (YLR091W) [Zygosaccharomyces parabailii]CDH12598.1 related to Genetic interactor of prohibitin 5,mitochondrial [Zygosaccharomyces bailii ISA1307]
MGSGVQEWVNGLHSRIAALPLHKETIRVLAKYSERNSERALSVAQEVCNYERGDSSKALEMLICRAHMLWNNPLPPHLKNFQANYAELRNHWPYEHHRSLLYMENPRKESLAYLWRDCNSSVLRRMCYDKHRWADDSALETLTPTQRQQLLDMIFHHYLFLKNNVRLCQNSRKLPVPIVEIPMRPLGNDAADSRIRNIFKHKIAMAWNLLAWDNRPLSRENELLLSDIIRSASSRTQKRLYQRACRRSYIISQGPSDEKLTGKLQSLHFSPSPLLLRAI